MRDLELRAQFLNLNEVPDDLLFLDESGFHTGRPGNRGQNVTFLCALTSRGPCAELVVDGGVDGDVFVTSVRQVPVPVVREEQVVVEDNIAAHHHAEVRALIEHAGAVFVLLPYAPDPNPIELMFSKLKAAMRRLAERTRQGVVNALPTALDTISATDVQGWFKHARSLLLW